MNENDDPMGPRNLQIYPNTKVGHLFGPATPSLYWGWLALPPSAVRTLRACGNDHQVVSLIVKWANSFL